MTINRWWTAAIGVAAVLLIAGPAQAGTFKLVKNDFSKNAGEFAIEDYVGPISGDLYDGVTKEEDGAGGVQDDGSDFHTFCLEKSEKIKYNNTYYYQLSDEVLYNGVEGNTNPLEDSTAKLYYAFWANAWADSDSYTAPEYDYDDTTTDGRLTSALDMQDAVWYLEGQIGFSGLSTEAKNMANWAGDVTWSELGKSGWTGIGMVRVMNVFTDTDFTFENRAQDVLVVVPLPAAALMGFSMLGLLGVAAHRRRRKA